ncbi:MAG TPA: tetratricopeptide repeat protein [Flavobacteriales bacterium]|nr:tetratricopeptide repeat protein [Flavobacteriales bacterium]HMR27795.1 tetratricopeptide repeat protein [Flavobacteriales bacterium]
MRSFIVGVWVLCALGGSAQDRNERELRTVRRLLDQGKVYPALRRCDGLMTRDMPKAPVLLLRAEANARVRSHPAAIEDARAALAGGLDDRGRQQAWFWTGMAWLGLQQGDSAIMAFERAAPGPERDLRMAMSLSLTGRCREAIALYDALLATNESTAALRERGACLAREGDTARARTDLDRAIALDPRDPVNWNSRGFHRWALHGDHERALSDYAQAIKLNPNYTYAINNRGYSRLKLGQVDKARRDVLLAGRRNADNPYVDHNRGLIALAEGDGARACGAFRMAEAKGGTPLYGRELDDLLKACPRPIRPDGTTAPGAPPPTPNAPTKAPAHNAPGRNAP